MRTLNSKMQGAGLIEVMVAFLVLGIGLLGILGMQSASVQYSQQAYLYSQATLLAQDIAEKMRSNQKTVASNYEIEFGATPPSYTSNYCVSNACTPAIIADWDVSVWRSAISKALPQGSGEIRKLQSAASAYLIEIRFDADRGEGELDTVTMEVVL